MDITCIAISSGCPASRADGVNAMQLVAWMAGEEHTDAPRCASPIITAFVQEWGYVLMDDETCDRLLKPLLHDIIGTRTTESDELRRAWLILDWMTRTYAPTWLDLVPSLRAHAVAMRGLPEIVDLATIQQALKATLAAKKDAAAATPESRDAETTEGKGAYDAAKYADWDAAGNAARVARGVAWDAACDAVLDAAGDVAFDASRAAAYGASFDRLHSTTESLQASVQDLIRRLCGVGR